MFRQMRLLHPQKDGKEQTASFFDAYSIRTTLDNCEVVQNCDVLILAVKPKFYEEVITQVRDQVRAEQIVVSIAPGKTVKWLEGCLKSL